MRFLFVMDPALGMLPDKDTSFAFMRGAGARGHRTAHCLPSDVGVDERGVVARARSITVSDHAPHVTLGDSELVALEDFDAVFVRKDPPFDAAYLHLTQVLDLAKDRVLVVNDPAGLRDANEKLFALRFREFMPETLVSSDPRMLLEFVATRGPSVLKPLDGAGGSGVVQLRPGDKNNRALADLLTSEGRALAMIQTFLPAIERGDKRVLLLDGRPLGAIRRVPRPDDIRANIHVGGSVEATTLSPNEQRLIESLAPTLRASGLYFVGLDLIAERLIEVNVTSPTGLQELGRLTSSRPEDEVIAWVEVASREKRA